MKKLFTITTFVLMSLASIAFAQETKTIEIGNGTVRNEVVPIHNWWQRSYTGNETLYLKEELGMQPGDKITALSYHCIYNSAAGGNYNVRIINTTLSRMIDEPVENCSEDTSILQVPFESTIYGSVHLDPYSADCWITFELDTPFEYTGDNIIIDIRNSEPCTRRGWVYFASTDCDQCMSIAWRNAADEAITGFVSGYDPYGNYDSGFYGANPDEGNRANIRITYVPNNHYPKIADVGHGNVRSETSPIVNWNMNSYQGSETIYLKEDLGLEKGDTISAFSYRCISHSAHGGNFNVRLMNTEETTLYNGTEWNEEQSRDISLIRLNYTDTVYANVQLNPYSAGSWVTFKLTKPFIYTGDNILIDIRNTEPGSSSFLCEFSSTPCDDVRGIWWRRANGEDVTEFVSSYESGIGFAAVSWWSSEDDWNNKTYPNIRIFANGMLYDVNDDSEIDITDVTALIDHLLGGDVEPFNSRNADVNNSGNVDIADVTALSDWLLTDGGI